MKKLTFLLIALLLFSGCSQKGAKSSTWEECCSLNTEVLVDFISLKNELRDVKYEDLILKELKNKFSELRMKIEDNTKKEALKKKENQEVKTALQQLQQLEEEIGLTIDAEKEEFENQMKLINEKLEKIEKKLIKQGY